jgi:hypothetical protein
MGHSLFLLGAAGGFVGVIAHGWYGHRAVVSPLRERTFATTSFGDADMTWRIWLVSWHLITLYFALTGVTFLLLALGAVDGGVLPRFLGSVFAAFGVTAFLILGRRLPAALPRPIPIVFTLVMTSVALVGWLG